MCRAGLNEPLPCCHEAVRRNQDFIITFAGFLGANDEGGATTDRSGNEVERSESGDVRAECCGHGRRGVGPADQQQSPALSAVLHFGLGAVEEEFPQRVIGLIADLTHVLEHDGIGLHIASEVGEHFPLVGQQAGVAALAGLKGEEIVADDALEPLHTIVAGHAKFAPMGEVGDADLLPDSAIFSEHVPVVQRDLPAGDVLECGPKACMPVM